jgi:type VI secretion system protein ImpA
MPSIEIESLLAPISADAPCGEDLEYDPEYAALARLANPTVRERVVGPDIPIEEPPWPQIQQRAIALFARSKDLRVANILTRAAFRTSGFPGFSQGMSLIRAMCERYWKSVHPLLDDDGDGTMRINALREQCSRQSVLIVRSQPFISVKGLGQFSLKDFAHLTGEAPQPAAAEAGKYEAALANCDLTQLQGILADVTSVLTDLRALETWVTEQLGYNQPLSFEELTTVLERMQRLLQTRVSSRGQTEVSTVQDSGPVAGGAGGTGGARGNEGGDVIRFAAPLTTSVAAGAIATRADVQRVLDQLCAWYEANEPSSPVPLLLKRAKRLTGMSFMDIVRDLAPEGAAQVEVIRGPESADNS